MQLLLLQDFYLVERMEALECHLKETEIVSVGECQLKLFYLSNNVIIMPLFLYILSIQCNYIDYIFILLFTVKHRIINSLYYYILYYILLPRQFGYNEKYSNTN